MSGVEPEPRARTDLASMLKEAQSAILRLVKEAPELRDATIEPSQYEWACQRMEKAYGSILKIQAPMVRCSRPAFRKLCRLWGTDISYTHMIMADSFACSEAARQAEFSIYSGETRLITQLASSSGPTAATAAAIVAPWCDAIDLNCGCPQRRVMADGLGAALLRNPEVVADTVRCVRNALEGGVELPCVVKMRVKDDVRLSVDFARQCEAAGAAWITVHGRTPNCSAHAPVRFDAINTIREALGVPVVANGGVRDPSTALQAALTAGVGGVMSGMGLLANPACFYVPGADEKFHFEPQHIAYGTGSCPWESGSEVREEHIDARKRCLSTGHSGGERDAKTVWPKGFSHCPLEVLSDFIRLSCVTDLGSKATSMHLLKMGGNYLSPVERTFIAEMHSSFSVIAAFQQLGLYVREGRFQVE
ncbi:tRNA-dihydrouridine synthase 4, putative [Trypanosoma equiperdum]|uniref:tRNA-dihydrouridine synthase 4, putative n=2 Tax=Trypanozoon TaxID=39700 RepID=Q583Y8_TRYB2|nr:tRNA-dihydrouridine synthase 4, putative [Trypanosoma brucei brucei TREU927]AAX79841.1 tRNA-dihydrouridine synthase 4, putative [Trypanosoma brucei]AAZ10902.1 tRNA-dihydrouridine synthase 4, putative [Trypanosoma brucei brucei TREU927]SCU67091.1 tRNA-dihydrouridine synthase 4, putative [Trypanosoma equiperdum]